MTLQVEQEFRAELQALLDRWDAVLDAKDHYVGYAECGTDVRMTVYIPTVYGPGGTTIKEGAEINLGDYLTSTKTK